MRLRTTAVLLWGAIVACVLVGGVIDQSADALCMNPGPPCQEFWRTPVVFEGTPRGRTPTVLADSMGERKMPASLVHFAINKAWRGLDAGRSTVDVAVLGGPLPDGTALWVEEQPEFQDGRRYLVYAWPNKQIDAVGTSACTRTGPVEERAEDLAYLATLDQPATGGRIFGTLSSAVRLPNVTIVLQNGATRSETRTDANGVFEFRGLQAGKYRLLPTLPAYLRGGPDPEPPIDLPDPRACANVNLTAFPDGRISGSLRWPDGRPAAKFPVGAMFEAQVGSQWATPVSTVTTDEDGRFQFGFLPPSRYVVGINLDEPPSDDCPYPRTLYPGVHDVTKATVVGVALGQHVQLDPMVVPGKAVEREVRAIVVSSDGRPAPAIKVLAGGSTDYAAGTTDERGQVSFRFLDGQRIQVYVQDSQRVIVVRSPEIVVGEGLEPIRLALPPPK